MDGLHQGTAVMHVGCDGALLQRQRPGGVCVTDVVVLVLAPCVSQ